MVGCMGLTQIPAGKKVRQYLHAGVREIWQKFPDERIVGRVWSLEFGVWGSGQSVFCRVKEVFSGPVIGGLR